MSITRSKQREKAPDRKKAVAPDSARSVEVRPEAAVPQPSPDFERELEEHFTAETRKKLEAETETIFGTVLARHGWVRNEHGQVEYVGGEGA